MAVSAADFAALSATVANHTKLIDSLEEEITATDAALSLAKAEVDVFYIMFAAVLVFLMQCGFATLEAGSIRAKNVRNVLLKNVLDACVGAVVWYLWGFGLASGGNSFIGNDVANFALSGRMDSADGSNWINFFFTYTFAAAASTIVSGAVAERCKLTGYICYTFIITGFIYPVVVHWVWDGGGIFYAGGPNAIMGGAVDFAGSGVVHMTGGVAGLVGAWWLGPRIGRWENPDDFDGHSTPLQIIGTFLLWFGWYGFNGGSTLKLDGQANNMARVCVTTTMCAAVSGATGVLLKKFLPKALGGSGIFDVSHTCNSILGGLVGITAGCASLSAAGSFACGIVSAIVYHAASCLVRKLKIDDPLDAFAVHGACGFWGCLAVGLMSHKGYSYGGDPAPDGGAFSGDTNGSLLGASIVSCLVELCWVGVLSFVMFGLLKKLGLLRVDETDEIRGLDDSKHGGSAYKTSPQKV